MVLLVVGVLLVLEHFYTGNNAELLDWKPTRSPELEAQNEIDDVQQMIEAQNEMRRRRGVAGAQRAGAARRGGRRGARAAAPAQELSGDVGDRVARALIVGCGCRGRMLGQRLVEDGWAVRGTSRRGRD